jgi:hypothetical protein
MPLYGQASGGWTESSSALRILNPGIRNTIGVATDDAFTQANPCASTTHPSAKVNTTLIGVLSGSVVFTRPDAGTNMVGGPGTAAIQSALNADTTKKYGYSPLGLAINNAAGNAFENTPGIASGIVPYMSAMGSYGSQLYETYLLDTGAAITFTPGVPLIASLNGFLMPTRSGSTSLDTSTYAAEQAVKGVASTVLGIMKMIPDAVQTEVVFDSRI